MTRSNHHPLTTDYRLALTLALLLTWSQSAFAQQPPRPNETPRAVTLSLTEYNRLIDLASRPPQGALVAPVPRCWPAQTFVSASSVIPHGACSRSPATRFDLVSAA